MDYLGFIITSNFLKNPQPGNDMAFHRIFPFYGNLYIHKHWEFHGFSWTLNLRGSEDYWKSLSLLLLFPYYVNSLFPYFGNCMYFCFTRNIWETHYFGMFVFSHIFPLLWEFTFFHILGIAWISASPKIVEKPFTLQCLFFPHTFPVLWEFTFPMFWELYGFLLHPKYVRNP